MSYRSYLHAALDAVLTKAAATGKDYRSVVPVPYTDLANDPAMKLHKDMSALGLEVVFEVTFTERNESVYEEAATDKNKTRH